MNTTMAPLEVYVPCPCCEGRGGFDVGGEVGNYSICSVCDGSGKELDVAATAALEAMAEAQEDRIVRAALPTWPAPPLEGAP